MSSYIRVVMAEFGVGKVGDTLFTVVWIVYCDKRWSFQERNVLEG